MRLMRLMRGMGRIMPAGRRHYLLADGMHSCAYVPERTYRHMNRLLMKRMDEDPGTENSLRFLWSKAGGRYVLAVNPDGVEMTQTHGLARDTGGRVLIPCPYIQQIYRAYGLDPEWCGRLYLEELKNKAYGADNAGRPWLALFVIHD